MTENFGDIKEGFKHIGGLIEEMRFQSAVSKDNTDKVLIGINSKLDTLMQEEDAELVKLALTEMKNGIEDKHKFIVSKFADIENSYKELVMKAESQLSSDEVKRVFDIIATNLGIFSKDFSSQKALISEIGVQIESLKQDDNSKKEIIRNIALVKNDVEKFSNGFESIIVNLNEKFSELNQILIKLDSGESISEIKKDIENIFMSTNAVLSTMQVIDKKNREFEENISKFITKDDFNEEQEKISKLIAQNVQIANYVDGLPTQNGMNTLSEKIDTTVGIINALKNMITDTGEQNQRMLTAQLESLERKILNISTEEEFIGFRKELAEFSKEVIESTTAIRQELLSTNSELKILSEFLGSMNVKETFETFGTQTKASENSIRQSLTDSTEIIVKEIGKTKGLTKNDINDGINTVHKKIDVTKEELKEASKFNMANILEHIQGLVNDIFSVKSAIKLDNQENLDTIDTKFTDLKEEMASTSNFIAQANHKTSEEVKDTIKILTDNLASLQQDVFKTAEENTLDLKSSIEELKTIQNDFDIKNQGDIEKILAFSVKLSSEIEIAKQSLSESTQVKLEELSIVIQTLNQQLASSNSAINETLASGLQENSKYIEEMSEKVQNLIKDLSTQNDPFKGEVLFEVSTLKDLLENVKQEVSQTRNILDDTVKEQISTSLEAIETLIEKESGKYNSALYGLQNRLSEHLENVQQISQENNLKLDSSFKETAEIKSEILNIIERISELQNSSTISELTVEINRKYEGLLLNLTKLEEIFSSKNESSLQNLLTSIEDSFEEIVLDLNEQKNSSAAVSQEIIEEISEKTGSLKDQINLVGTDFINTINNKNEEFLNSLVPIKTSLETIESIDFEQMVLDIKNKINSLNFTISSSTKESIKEENDAQTQTLSSSLNMLNEKIDHIIENTSNDLSESFVSLKISLSELSETLGGNVKSLNDVVSKNLNSIEAKVLEAQQTANENLLEEISRLADPSEILKTQDNALEEIFDKIDKSADILESQDKIKEDLSEKIENTNVASVEEIINAQEDAVSKLIEKIDGLNASQQILNAQEDLKLDIFGKLAETELNAKESIVEELRQSQIENKSAIIEEITKAKESTEETILTELSENINVIKEVITTISGNNNLTDELSQKVENLHSAIQSITSQIDGNLSSSAETYKTSTQSALGELKTSFYEKVDDSLDDLKSFLEISQNEENISEEIDNLKTEFLEKFEDLSDSLTISLKPISTKKGLEALEENLKSSTTSLIEDFQEKLTTLVEAGQTEISGKTKEVNRRVEELKKVISDELSEKIATIELALENQKTDFAQGFEEIKTSIFELKENYVDLSLNSNMEMSNLLLSAQEKIDEISAKLEELNFNDDFADLSDKIGTVNFDEQFNNLSEKLENVNFDEKFENIENKINDLNVKDLFDNTNQDLSDRFDEVSEKLDILTNTSTQEMEEGINEIRETLQNQIEGFEKLSKLDSLDEIKEALAPLENLPTVEGLEGIKSDIQNALESFEKKFTELLGNIKIAEASPAEKIYAEVSEEDEFETESQEAQETENEEWQKEDLPQWETQEEETSQWQDAHENFDEIEPDFEEDYYTEEEPATLNATPSDIKADLDSLKTELFESIIEVFNQISFVAEADDIKDFVDGKIDEAKAEIIESLSGFSFGDEEAPAKTRIDIKEGIRSALGTNFEDILSSLDILHEKANTVDGNCYDIKNEIKEVKNKLIKSADSENYSYTLQDVETDIAKLRLILKELSETKPEINFDKLDSLDKIEKLNEDIVSISTRTNKLLLNSDESYNVLKDNLETFKDIISQVDNKLQQIDNSGSIKELNKKLENVNDLMLQSVKSDKIFNQTFIYLAEWIDKADEKMAKIEEKLTSVESSEKTLVAIQKSMLKSSDLEILLDKFSKQFDKQQEKIKSLETKIEKLTKKETTKGADVKSIVQEVLNKVQLPEFKPDAKLVKKVDGIDRQLSTLGKNIEKITSYVD